MNYEENKALGEPYFHRLDTEEQLYLLDHPSGCLCWQTDYKLLRMKQEAEDYANYLDGKAMEEAYRTNNYSKQKNLF